MQGRAEDRRGESDRVEQLLTYRAATGTAHLWETWSVSICRWFFKRKLGLGVPGVSWPCDLCSLSLMMWAVGCPCTGTKYSNDNKDNGLCYCCFLWDFFCWVFVCVFLGFFPQKARGMATAWKATLGQKCFLTAKMLVQNSGSYPSTWGKQWNFPSVTLLSLSIPNLSFSPHPFCVPATQVWHTMYCL